MKPLYVLTIHAASWAFVLAGANLHASSAEQRDPCTKIFTRKVVFELTYANRDLIWFGDPASPTALVYAKPGARPIATDMHVTTLVECNRSPGRHYMHEARIAADNQTRIVYAFTEDCEKVIGVIDHLGRFAPNQFYENHRELLPTWPADASALTYDSKNNTLYYEVEIPGPQLSESFDFLPLELSDAERNSVDGRFSINFASSADGAVARSAVVSLVFRILGKSLTLAKATVPSVFRRADAQLGSFDNTTGTYLPEAAYRAGAGTDQVAQPSVTFAFAGEFTSSVRSDVESLIVVASRRPADPLTASPAKITIDGNFDDWRNVTGVDDRQGDVAPYLDYVPDVDLLEFKVAHDNQHIYLYARVAGQVGRSYSDGGRSYFYAYMDVDQNPDTGFLPTRDDECYFGVDIGDDCEVQFEFVNNVLRKTFYGFCGLGGNDNVLKRKVTIGRSQYGRFDHNGVERANYKSEYIFRNGITEITEDLKLGSSDTIHLAISPDGREVEVVSAFTGFLKDAGGRPTLEIGRTIDLAVGMECDSKAYPGKTRWAADSTIAIRGYRLHTADRE